MPEDLSNEQKTQAALNTVGNFVGRWAVREPEVREAWDELAALVGLLRMDLQWARDAGEETARNLALKTAEVERLSHNFNSAVGAWGAALKLLRLCQKTIEKADAEMERVALKLPGVKARLANKDTLAHLETFLAHFPEDGETEGNGRG